MAIVACSASLDDSGGKPTNRRHEMFCRMVALGHSASDAYRKYIAAAKTDKTAEWLWNAAYMMKVRFGARIRELREKLQAQADDIWIKSKRDLLVFHSQNLELPPSAITPDSPFAKLTTIDGPDGPTTKLEQIDKHVSAQQIAKLAGYDAAQQVNHDHTHVITSPALDAYTALLRRQRAKIITQPTTLPDPATAQLPASLTDGQTPDQATDCLPNRLEQSGMHSPTEKSPPAAPPPIDADWDYAEDQDQGE